MYRVFDVARMVGCHRNTILNYEKRGIIQSYRDRLGYRRFTRLDVEKVRTFLMARRKQRQSHEGKLDQKEDT